MSYADILIENAKEISPAIFEQVISDAVYDACIAGGQEVFEAFETYAKILADKNLEPQEDFEEALDEVFTPFFENAASIYGGMLLEVAIDSTGNRVFGKESQQVKTVRGNKSIDNTKYAVKTAVEDKTAKDGTEASRKSVAPQKGKFMRKIRLGMNKMGLRRLHRGITSGLNAAKKAYGNTKQFAKTKIGAASNWMSKTRNSAKASISKKLGSISNKLATKPA